MAMQIDGNNLPRDPYDVRWEPKEVIDRAHSGKPLRNAYRRVVLMFDDLTPADFNTIAAYDDGGTHTVTIPHPTTAAYAAYAGAYFLVSRPHSFQDVHTEDVEFEVSWVVA